MDISVNYLAVLAAVIVNMVLGSLWYGPLFGKKWMDLMGLSKEKIQKEHPHRGKLYAVQTLASFVMAYVLFHFTVPAENFNMALEWAFWIWLGFVATVSLGSVLWGGRSKYLWVLDNAYYLVSLVVMTAMMYSWR